MSEVASICVDWGTSSFRAYRLDKSGEVLEGRRADAGILAIDDGDFEGAFLSLVGDWLEAHPNVPLLLSGMIGSRQGWSEAPYLDCPASVQALGEALHPLALSSRRQAWIAPGLTCHDSSGVPDVMRGEEVQILGALEVLELQDATFCLPGTHSKWARVSAGAVTGFQTYMTGEVFDVLRRESILGRMIEHAAWSEESFAAGVRRSGNDGHLLNQLFGVRAAGLFEQLAPETAGAFLSGLIIGHEVRAALVPEQKVYLLGESGLIELYATAIEICGGTCARVPDGATAKGLARLAEGIEA